MYNSPDEKWVRVVMFIALSVTGFTPFIHHALTYGLDVSTQVIDWKW